MLGRFLLKLLVGLTVGLTGAIGPLWLYGRARAEAAALQSQVRSLEQELGVREREIRSLRDSIQDQNQAVQTWKAEGEAKAAEVRRAQARAEALQAQSQARAQQTLSTPAPSSCEQAVIWAALEARRLAAEWTRP